MFGLVVVLSVFILFYSWVHSHVIPSCAWRHCGALADAQEALDELDSLVGVFEPFECLFCLDVVERSFRDILAVTKEFQDPSVAFRNYEPLKRMVSR